MANNRRVPDQNYSDLEERTLVVRNFDPARVGQPLLEELFQTFGPVRNVVLKHEFAFIEYSCKESVAYAIAMMTGVRLHNRKLRIHPKRDEPFYYKYLDNLRQFEERCRQDVKFLDHFVTGEDQKIRKNAVKKYKSNNGRQKIQDRLWKYGRHFDLESTSGYNPFFGEDILKSSNSGGSSSSSNHHHHHHRRQHYSHYQHHNHQQHQQQYRQDRYDDYHHHHHQAPPPAPPVPGPEPYDARYYQPQPPPPPHYNNPQYHDYNRPNYYR